jgi:arylsulfatase A-like enzyme
MACVMSGRSRGALAHLIVIIGMSAFGVSCVDASDLERWPPIVLITLDTTRRDHLPIYGYDRNTAPNLEQLARDGEVLSGFITTSSWTLPSHASLFTGLFPSTHAAHYSAGGDASLGDAVGARSIFGLHQVNRLPEEAVTLAEVLRDHGYATYGVGAGPWLEPVFGLGQGFDDYDAETGSVQGRGADEVTRRGVGFLRRGRGRSFLLFLNYFDPHDPYDPHETLWEQFLRPGPDPERSQRLAAYDAEIVHMDRSIGRVIDELERLGLYDRSWIVVTSDHGEHFGEHGLEQHGFSLYEDVVRGVLVIKPPSGVLLELDTEQRCQSVDVMPTLLAALGIDDPPPMEGQSLGAITHPMVTELFHNPGHVHWNGERFRRDLRAVYDGRYKLVVSSRPDDPDAGLFDLTTDPDEESDLRHRLSDVERSLLAELERWRSQLQPGLAGEPDRHIDARTRRQLEALGYLAPESK